MGNKKQRLFGILLNSTSQILPRLKDLMVNLISASHKCGSGPDPNPVGNPGSAPQAERRGVFLPFSGKQEKFFFALMFSVFGDLIICGFWVCCGLFTYNLFIPLYTVTHGTFHFLGSTFDYFCLYFQLQSHSFELDPAKCSSKLRNNWLQLPTLHLRLL